MIKESRVPNTPADRPRHEPAKVPGQLSYGTGRTGIASPPSDGGGGERLGPRVQAAMEHRFRTDFSAVRVHTDAVAARSARSFGAAAFTIGEHIFAGPGRDLERSPQGQTRLAHELAHVVQQRRRGPGIADAGAEHEAQVSAARFATRSVGPITVTGATGVALACQAEGADPEGPERVDPVTVSRQYEEAVARARQTGYWEQAAEKLNAFNHEDMQVRLAALSDREVGLMHQGALDNERLGPLSAAALLTDLSQPRASLLPPVASKSAPSPPATELDSTEGFQRRVRTVSVQRLDANVRNIGLWRIFIDHELAPEQLTE